MTAKRLVALVVAIGLVVVGFVIRNARDGGDDDPVVSPGPSAGTDEPEPDGDDDRPVICVPELDAVCDAIAAAQPARSVRTQDALATVDDLASDAPEPAPVWITVAPLPGIIDAQRVALADTPLGLSSTPIASTPLVVAAASQDRLDALAATCGDVDVWACLGDHAGERWDALGGQTAWGTLRPAVGDVAGSVTALASLRAAATGYFGTTDFSRTSWEADTGFLSWLRPLARTVSSTDLSAGTPLATMITRPSALDIAATTDAELAALGSRAESLATQYPRSAMALDAVVAAPEGAGGVDELVEIASTVLTDAGWDPPADPVGPSASTTLALLELWEATT